MFKVETCILCSSSNNTERYIKTEILGNIMAGDTNQKKKIIRKVWKNKSNNQKLVTIPKESDIDDGDYVEVIKQ